MPVLPVGLLIAGALGFFDGRLAFVALLITGILLLVGVGK